MNRIVTRAGLVVVLLGCVAFADGSMTKYGVTAKVAKHTDFTKLKTYAWTTGWAVFDRAVDRQIIAAVDLELAARGLTRRDGEPCDAIVQYASLQRTDVDLKSKVSLETNMRRNYPVGTLVILLLEPKSRREMFRGRIDMPLETDPARLEAQINRAVTQIFGKYPRTSRGTH